MRLLPPQRFDRDRARAARIAGYRPKNRPTKAVIEMPSTTDQGSTMAGSGLTWLMIQATRNPSTVPTMPPNVDSVIDSVRICHRMSRRRAPSDLRRPISRVRSRHDHQHDVHDDDAADDEREADDADQDREDAGRAPGCRGRGTCPTTGRRSCPVSFGRSRRSMRSATRASSMAASTSDRVGRPHRQPQRLPRPEDPLQRAERDDGELVLRLAEDRRPSSAPRRPRGSARRRS